MKTNLLQKYNVPVSRYTSYPTVPFWGNEKIDAQKWVNIVQRTFAETNATEGISLYVHLPFCESLCTYCGCNKRITKNHGVEPVYMRAVQKEWSLYREILPGKPLIRELHLGGGTPTFFSPENLEILLKNLLKDAEIHPDAAFSFEGHPNNTTYEHLLSLYKLGFKRVSFGVQDLSEKVQIAIHRVQPIENVQQVTEWAREIGYTSINFDLIYGLPFQTAESIQNTFEQVIQLNPDRIAFYSYAHVPWLHKAQRGYSDEDLPKDLEKFNLYEIGRKLLLQAGYHDVGMDHFAKEEDELHQVKLNGKLHRNFMGYTTHSSNLLIGLGVSSISDAGNAYAQNEKVVEDYYKRLAQNELPLTRGYIMNSEDRQMRQHILDIACKGKTSWNKSSLNSEIRDAVENTLSDLEQDGLIEIQENEVTVTQTGQRFIRNICAAFDLKLLEQNKAEAAPRMFSQAV